MITVLKIEPHKKPVMASLEPTLAALRNAVSAGTEESVNVRSKGIGDGAYIVYAADGIIHDLEPNRKVIDEIICGTFFVVAVSDEGYATTLTDGQVREYSDMFGKIEHYSYSETLKDWSGRFMKELDEMDE